MAGTWEWLVGAGNGPWLLPSKIVGTVVYYHREANSVENQREIRNISFLSQDSR